MLHQRTKGIAKQIAIGIGGFTMITIAVIWSWNTLAVDLFDLSPIQFKHATAIVLAFVVARMLLVPRRFHAPRNRVENG